MNREIVSLLKTSNLADAQIVGNLAMVGIINPDAPESSETMPLDRAMRNGVVRVNEAGGFTQLQLSVTKPVLVRTGQGVLRGGLQDRIFKQGEVITDESVLDVYCIERGRWSGRKNTNWISHDIPLAIREAALRNFSQEQVWHMVNRYLSEWGVPSDTQALGAIYDAVGKKFEKFVSNFEAWNDQIGMIIVIDGLVRGLELFRDKQSFIEEGMQILQNSYVPEALRGNKIPIFPDQVGNAINIFLNELDTGSRLTDVVWHQNEVIYCNVI